MTQGSELQRQSATAFQYALRKASGCLAKLNYEGVAVWGHVASQLAWRNFPGFFCSEELESLLREAGSRVAELPVSGEMTVVTPASDSAHGRLRVVHVLSTAYVTGGHTRVVARWISNRSELSTDEQHSAVLLNQGESVVPEFLLKAVARSGGCLYRIRDHSSYCDRAAQLRRFVRDNADLVILHVHPDDPTCLLALTDNTNGPTVFFFNHADHVFSIGMSIASRVLDFRQSGLNVTKTERVTCRESMLLPLPLEDPYASRSVIDAGSLLQMRAESRDLLGISRSVRVGLTIGSEYKYRAIGQADFGSMATQALSGHDDRIIIAVGLPDRAQWAAIADSTAGRFRPLGVVEDPSLLQNLFQAADFYLEGIPMGSVTAMLDAGLYGLPLVRFRYPEEPLLSGDDIALDPIVPRYDDVRNYVSDVERLCSASNGELLLEGMLIRQAILGVHCGGAWSDSYLSPVMRAAVRSLGDCSPAGAGTAEAPLVGQHESGVSHPALTEILRGHNSDNLVMLDAAADASLSVGMRFRLVCQAFRRGEVLSSSEGILMLLKVAIKLLPRSWVNRLKNLRPHERS